MMKRIAVVLTVLMMASVSQATLYFGNGNSGFGGPIGQGSLDISDDGFDMILTLNRGPGAFNNNFVIYFDSQAGGFSDNTGMYDQADNGRRAVSGWNGSGKSAVTFGFGADFALSIDAVNGGFLYGLANGGNNSLNAVAAAGGGGTTTDASYVYAVALSDLDVAPNSGSTISFVATYINGDNAFLSDEGYGDGLPPVNPGNPSSVTFTSPLTYTTVPEPASAVLCVLGLTALALRRRLSA